MGVSGESECREGEQDVQSPDTGAWLAHSRTFWETSMARGWREWARVLGDEVRKVEGRIVLTLRPKERSHSSE